MNDRQPITLWASVCPRGDGDNVLAVVAFTPALAREILRTRERFLVFRRLFPGLSWVVLDSADCRFFDPDSTDEPAAVGALFDAFAATTAAFAIDDEEDRRDRWWPLLTDIVLPEGGDYRTDYEHLQVGEHYICWTGRGKHAGEEFETADVPLDFLRERAAAVDSVAP